MAPNRTRSPLVSVIVPIHNKEQYIAECLDGILAQSLKDIEVVCVNNNSTDNSAEIVKEYARKDTRVKLLSEKRQGAGMARNKGMEVAEGEFLAFMDADDSYYDDQALEKLYRAAKNEGVSIAGGNIYLVDARGQQVENPMMKIKKYGLLDYGKDFQYNYGFTRFIYERRLLVDNGIAFPDLLVHEDPIFMTRALLAAGKLFVIKDYVYTYKVGVTDHSLYSDEQLRDMKRGIFQEVVIAENNGLHDLYELLLRQVDDFVFFHVERARKGLRLENARLGADLEKMQAELARAKQTNEQLRHENSQLRAELAAHASIKQSARLLASNIKRRIKHGKKS